MSGPPQMPGTAYAPQPAQLGPPGVGIAGFVMVLVGLFVPLVGLVGFILSWVGYAQAKREGRPQGLALAGTIIGAVATILGVLFIILIIAISASSS